jgi:heptaprenyl diphosphate synthase
MSQLPIPAALVADLEQLDQIIADRVQSRSAVIQVAGHYLLASGDKRIRGALTLLAAQLGTYDLNTVIHSAAAIELIHAALLVHDDLVDETEQRRGIYAVHTRWDDNVALMVGDYLLALASAEMALAPDPRIIGFFSRGVMTICEGQLAPVMALTPLNTALEQYQYQISSKTAALFEAACKAGMVCGGGSPEQIEAMGRFGYELGMAFQIVDDVLDFTTGFASVGKPVGYKVRNGIITLPLIYAADVEQSSEFGAIIDAQPPTEEQVAWVIQEVQRLGGTERALEDARKHIERAHTHLADFPDGPTRQALKDIADYVISRTQ